MTQPVGDSLEEIPASAATLVTIGNFDGVHLGHRAVLVDATRAAAERGLVPIALTFDPHPTVAVGRPPPQCLTSVDRKIELLRRIDPELRVVVQRFDATFAAQSPDEFAKNVLVDRLRARCVRVGSNFRFGNARRGDLETLVALGEKYKFESQAAPLVGDERGRYSSSRARKAIVEGNLQRAREILGRPHSLCGQVTEGQRRARDLGFPTANLAWVREALPPHGVYVVVADLIDAQQGAKRLASGVCNVGVRPTVDAGFAVEVHLFDFDGDLYGERLRIHLLGHLRAEKKFSGLVELRQQIELDSQRAREALRGLAPDPDAGEAWF